MSLLTIIQDVSDRVDLDRPSTVVSNSAQLVRQLLALANQEGIELAKRHSWQTITAEQTFTSTVAETQTGAIPSAFDRFINGTFFNRTAKRHVKGPLTPQEWQFHKSVVATTIIEAFRQRGDSILITPTPAASQTYAFEYVSKNWCESSGGTDQSAWAADTDVGLLPEELMKLGIIWRWKQAKGLDYAESFRTYESEVANAISRDGGKPTLIVGGNRYSGPRLPIVKDGSWPL